MKKLFTLIFTIILLSSFTACSGDDNVSSSNKSQNQSDITVSKQVKPLTALLLSDSVSMNIASGESEEVSADKFPGASECAMFKRGESIYYIIKTSSEELMTDAEVGNIKLNEKEYSAFVCGEYIIFSETKLNGDITYCFEYTLHNEFNYQH